MTHFIRSTLVAAALAAVVATPVHAMGHSGAPTASPETHPAVERLTRMESEQKVLEAGLQAQVDLLRKELADLKAKLALVQPVASAE